MSVLLDTGILLRFVDEKNSQHALIRTVIGTFGDRKEDLYITTQNIAERFQPEGISILTPQSVSGSASS